MFSSELIDELIKDYDGPESFWGESGIFADLKKRTVERTLDVEMDDHLGYSKHDPNEFAIKFGGRVPLR